MAERSNSFNSNIDWTVHGLIDRWFETAWRHSIHFRFVRSFVSFSATLIAWTERLHSFVRIREASFAHAHRVSNQSLTRLHINRFVFAHAREASINIHTYRLHTHTHTDGLGLQLYATLQRKGSFVLLDSTGSSIIITSWDKSLIQIDSLRHQY